jgi:hypothetical protein
LAQRDDGNQAEVLLEGAKGSAHHFLKALRPPSPVNDCDDGAYSSPPASWFL